MSIHSDSSSPSTLAPFCSLLLFGISTSLASHSLHIHSHLFFVLFFFDFAFYPFFLHLYYSYASLLIFIESLAYKSSYSSFSNLLFLVTNSMFLSMFFRPFFVFSPYLFAFFTWFSNSSSFFRFLVLFPYLFLLFLLFSASSCPTRAFFSHDSTPWTFFCQTYLFLYPSLT